MNRTPWDGLNVNPRPAQPPDWPRYCCAILRDGEGRYLLELRPKTAKHAPGKLTCFGGLREEGEHPDRCLRRELKEELGWSVGALHMDVAVRLMMKEAGGERVVAWFYRGKTPRPSLRLHALPGHEIVWVDAGELANADLSDWHRAAIEAEIRGESAARVPAKGVA